jgi:hypothetical protein
LIALKDLEDNHLLNIQRASKHGTVKVSEAESVVIEAEITKRGLELLPPYESMAHAVAVASTSKLYWRKYKFPGDVTAALDAVESCLQSGTFAPVNGLDLPICIQLEALMHLSRSLSDTARKDVASSFRRWRSNVVDQSLSHA